MGAAKIDSRKLACQCILTSGYKDMNLAQHVETLNLLGDESRLRLCALLRERELCVTDLVRVTGIAQSRVSTHLGRLREAGFVRDRRQGAQSFYALAADDAARARRGRCSTRRRAPTDPTLDGDQQRLRELDAERRGGLPESAVGRARARLLAGPHLAVAGGRHRGAARARATCSTSARATARRPASLAPYCRSLTCIDTERRA